MLERCIGIAGVGVIVLMAGCGWVRDSGNDYRTARELPPLTMPEGLDDRRIQSFYVIPAAQDAVLSPVFEVPRPEPLGGDANDQSVRIQKLADEQWIVANLAPDQAWPLLRAFLASNRVPLVIENGNQGLMVTDWLQPEGPQPKEQYLVRIDSGVQSGSSEVHVRQRVSGNEIQAVWPEQSDNREREYKFLYQLATYLASNSGEASVSLLAQGIRVASKVSLQQANGQPYLLLELPYARAWASVGNALEAANLENLDQDYSAGMYLVRQVSIEQPGWWARLWGADAPEAAEIQLTVTAVDASRVSIRVDQAGGMSTSEQLRYLGQIKGNLR